MWTTVDSSGAVRTTTAPAIGIWQPIINVKDYGAKGDGATNDRASIQAAINAAQVAGVSGRGVSVWFPSGVYSIDSVLTVLQNNISLIGEDFGSTIILPTFTTGDVVQFGEGTNTYASLAFRGMQIFCGSARTTGASLNINKCNDVFVDNFSINNCFVGVLIQGASIKVTVKNGTINNVHVGDGSAIQVNNGLAGDTYIGPYIISSNAPASKPLAGIDVIVTGHISIFRVNVTSCLYGLYVHPGANQDVNYMFIDHSLFDSCGTYGAYFFASNATAARIRSVMSLNSWYSGTTTATAYGIFCNTAGGTSVLDGCSFIGCRILNNQNHGVQITAGTNISFTDCTVAGNGAQTINTYDGISIGANVSGITVSSCKLGQAGTASNQQRYAINVAAGTSGNLIFVLNDCQPNGTVGTHGYINIGALTGGGITIDKNNPGIDKCFGSAITSASAGINTTNTIISSTVAASNRLMANALRAGCSIRFTVIGTCTATVANASTFRVYMGTNNTTGDTAVLTAAVTSAATGTAVPFLITITLTCRTVGGSASFYGAMTVLNNGVTGISSTADANLTVLGTMATVASTSALYVNLAYVSAATTTTTTFQVVAMEVVNN
jgi:hypothetical protein